MKTGMKNGNWNIKWGQDWKKGIGMERCLIDMRV